VYVQQYTSSGQYLKEGGRPVVCIFGIGLHDRAVATPSSSLALIKWLQAQNLYVIGSGPYYWREGGHDAAPGFDAVHAAFDAIMPWAVGRYKSAAEFASKSAPVVKADAKLTSGRGQDYAPIAYAGYSYRDSGKINFIKRYAGAFFDAQIQSHLATAGATWFYIAMFDEVQEGTAIYKFAANEAESAAGREFVTASIDGVACPGDHYLAMAGQYAAAAKGGPPPPPGPGPAPSGPDTLKPGDTLASGKELTSASGSARLSMQASDGNLVLYTSGGKVRWSSGVDGHPRAELRFQASDGNLVEYDGAASLWSSGPASGAAKAQLLDDCNFVTSDASGKVLWALGTSC
jgi:hypothetical protein